MSAHKDYIIEQQEQAYLDEVKQERDETSPRMLNFLQDLGYPVGSKKVTVHDPEVKATVHEEVKFTGHTAPVFDYMNKQLGQ